MNLLQFSLCWSWGCLSDPSPEVNEFICKISFDHSATARCSKLNKVYRRVSYTLETDEFSVEVALTCCNLCVPRVCGVLVSTRIV